MAKRAAKRKDKQPQPVRSQATQIDRELAARALQKRAASETPSPAELAALRRWEVAQEEERRWRIYESLPKKDWEAMSGRQPKVINEQADRYGLPLRGVRVGRHSFINLPAVVRAFHDFLATNARKLAADEDIAQTHPAMVRYRLAAAELLEMELDTRKRNVLPRDEVHGMLGRVGGVLRTAGEILQQRFGREAHAVLEEALDSAEDEIRRYFADDKDEAGQQKK